MSKKRLVIKGQNNFIQVEPDLEDLKSVVLTAFRNEPEEPSVFNMQDTFGESMFSVNISIVGLQNYLNYLKELENV